MRAWSRGRDELLPWDPVLLRFPNVVLWVNGHTHVNNVIPHRRHPESPLPGGFWELGLNDWQSRARSIPGADGKRGTAADRNVELLLPAPF